MSSLFTLSNLTHRTATLPFGDLLLLFFFPNFLSLSSRKITWLNFWRAQVKVTSLKYSWVVQNLLINICTWRMNLHIKAVKTTSTVGSLLSVITYFSVASSLARVKLVFWIFFSRKKQKQCMNFWNLQLLFKKNASSQEIPTEWNKWVQFNCYLFTL